MPKFYFSLYSLLISLIIIIIFNAKSKVNSDEIKIYGNMLMLSLFDTILGSFIQFFSYNYINDTLLIILNKSYYIILLFWMYTFFLYFLNANLKTNLYQTIKKSFFIVNLVLSFIIIITPLTILIDIMDVDGLPVLVLYSGLGMYILLTSLLVFAKFSEMKRKAIPFIAFLGWIIIIFIMRFVHPELDLASVAIVIVNLIMYFTIENPDIKIIERLNILKNQAEISNNTKTTFLKQMRHEINTPATQVQYYNEFIREKAIEIKNNRLKREEIIKKNEEIISDTNFIELGIKDFKAIVSNAILIADLENKSFVLEEFIYKTSELVERINHVVNTNYSDKEKITFNLTINKEMPPTLIGDYQMFESIILNLLSNAFKYTYEGTIDLNINTSIKENICYIIISVKDTGIGIQKDEMPKLFNKFERPDFEHNQNDKRGAGLGLSIVKQLANIMGGDIKVHSDYGKGTVFTVNIKQKIVKGE